MASLVPPEVDSVRVDMVEPCEAGESTEVVGGVVVSGVTVQRRRFKGEGIREVGEVPLFVAFLDSVSTKLDFSDRATDDSVAWSRRVRSGGEGRSIRRVDGVERSAFRCSMVVVVVFWEIGGR